jgi:DNA polymerase V
MSNAHILCDLTPGTDTISFFDARVPAGFPSPATDHVEKKISLDDLLDIHAPHTYLVRVSGDSMIGAGIYDCDILVVSRAREARHRDIVVAALNGDVLVKRIWLREQTILMPENPAYAPRYILEGDELQVWGIVTHSIRSHATGEPK